MASFRAKSYAPDDDFWYSSFPLQETVAGIKVDEATALKYLVVFSCVTLIAGDVARLPLILIKKSPDGSKERVMNHRAYGLCHDAPNDEMDARTWIETGLGHNLLWGNSYSLMLRNKVGEVMEIWPVDNPGAVEVYRAESGGLRYKWRVSGGGTADYGSEDILHVHGFGFNGLMGVNPVSIASDAIGLGIALNQFAAQYFGQGTHPSGMISLPSDAAGRMDPESRKQYKKFVTDQYSGIGKSHSLMVLTDGEKFESFTQPLNDSQFLESRDHQKKEICGFYRVPAHKVQIHGANSNYNNMEQENQSYVDSCLIHWVSRMEKAFTHQILSPADRAKGLSFEFVMDGLLRGDSQSRGDFYGKMVTNGIFSRNEVRKMENRNPLPDEQLGDETYVPLNLIPAKDASKIFDDDAGADTPTSNQIEDLAGRSILESRAAVEKRSVLIRDRIGKNYLPLLRDAAQAVVNRETKAIQKQVEKLQRNRSEAKIKEFIEELYRQMPEYIKLKFGPVLRAYAEAIYAASADEINIDPSDPEIATFIEDYIETYILRHNGSSEGQMLALADEGDLDAITQRASEWADTRADRIARNEVTRASNALYQAVAFSAGMSTAWRIRGADTCDFCKELNGRRVRSGQAFAVDGQEIEPAGADHPMRIRGIKAHPPLHRGCDCYLSMG